MGKEHTMVTECIKKRPTHDQGFQLVLKQAVKTAQLIEIQFLLMKLINSRKSWWQIKVKLLDMAS